MFGFEMEEDQILKQLTKNKSGILYSLNDLEKSGKTFLYSCIHLLLNEDSPQTKNKNTYKSYLFLENNKNINVNKNEVLYTLSNFVDSGGYLFNMKKRKFLDLINSQIESNIDSTPKRPKMDNPEWLVFVKNQCGEHDVSLLHKKDLKRLLSVLFYQSC